MRVLVFLLAIVLSAAPCFAAPHLGQLSVDATFAPPHNEPVIGNKVARYRVRLLHNITWEKLEWEGQYFFWGVSTWRHPSTIDDGFPAAWEDSDWSVEEWRLTQIHRVSYRTSTHVDLFVEHKREQEFPGNRSYYYLVGIRFRLH